jgi:acyl carrier protein
MDQLIKNCMMDTNKFIKDFVTIFDEEPLESIKFNTNFRDIEGWSSMTALAFIALMDEEYNVKIKVEEIRNSVNVEDLYNIVKSQK